MFQVEIKKSAKRELDSCPLEYKERIVAAIKFLSQESYPFKYYDTRKVKETDNVFGIRIGKYRVLYEVSKVNKIVLVFKVELKSETTYK